MFPRSPRFDRLALAQVLLVLVGCASTSSKSTDKTEARDRPAGEIIEATNQPVPIGKLLVEIDASIRAWNNLLLTADTAEERRKARMLEDNLSRVAHQRRAEIIEQLESGPLNNRVVAASALGFTRDVQAQSPLIAALDDAYPEVVSNALLGLMLLGRTDTPLDPICRLMQSSPDESIRRNAAQCLGSLVQAGARSECVRQAARQGLSDAEPGVRSQSAILLAILLDTESLPTLCDLLSDEVPLVAAAAARAVAYIGEESPPQKGVAARALSRAFGNAKGTMRDHFRRALVSLAGVDRGDEAKEWAEWANRLP